MSKQLGFLTAALLWASVTPQNLPAPPGAANILVTVGGPGTAATPAQLFEYTPSGGFVQNVCVGRCAAVVLCMV